MAKRGKVLPARKSYDRPRDDDSLLLRSAESLGRVIGALQRQLDGATRRLTVNAKGNGQPASQSVKRTGSTTASTKTAKARTAKAKTAKARTAKATTTNVRAKTMATKKK